MLDYKGCRDKNFQTYNPLSNNELNSGQVGVRVTTIVNHQSRSMQLLQL